MVSSPWDHFKEKDLFCREAGEYDISLYTQPKERSTRSGHSKLKTKGWEDAVFQATEEQAPRIIPAGRLGLRILFMTTKKTGDLSNMLKSLEDALRHRAFHDDEGIDYIETLRVYGPDIPNRILTKVLERI